MKKNIARYTWVAAVIFFVTCWGIPRVRASDSETVVMQTVAVGADSKSISEFDVNIDETTFDESQVHSEPLRVIEDVLSTEAGQAALPIIMQAIDLGASLAQQKALLDEPVKESHESESANEVVTAPKVDAKVLPEIIAPAPEKKAEVAAVVVPTSTAPAHSTSATPASEKKPSDVAQPDDVSITTEEKKALQKEGDETPLVSEKKHSIILNASMPLTGSMALVGRDYLTGINLVFDKFNRAGGLDKKYLIKYVTADDRYVSTVSKENIVKGAKESPLFIGNFGSHALATIEDLIVSNDVVMFFPTVGDTRFRKKEYRNVINLRPSMECELRSLITYAINDRHRKKIAVFYEENQWGKSGLAIVEKVLQEFGLSPCARGSYPANTIAVVPASSEIIKSRPDAIICISTYRPTYNFIQLVLNEGFQHCLFLGLGPSTPMQQLLKKSRGVTIATTSVVPDPVRSKLPIVEAYRKDMAKYFPLREMSQYSLEGYLAGSVFISALKQLEAPYTAEKMLSFFEKLTHKDFGGFKVNFNPATRELSSKVWINKGVDDAEWDASFCG